MANLSKLLQSSLYEKVYSLNEDNLHDFHLNNSCSTIYGNCAYNIISDGSNWYCIGEKKPFNSVEKLIDYLNEKYNECLEYPTISEELAYAKFRYRSKFPNKGYQIHDPQPKVIVLDSDYIYNGKGKIVDGQHDILAFNINYSKNKKPDKLAIQEIVSFAQMIKKNKKDIYERIKEFYPNVIPFIRHYKPEQMTKLKKKNGWFWKQCSIADLAPKDDWK